MDTVKIFWSGGSQAVRLPKAFRVEATELRIRLRGNAIILEPVEPPVSNWDWLDRLIGPVDAGFVAAALEDSPSDET